MSIRGKARCVYISDVKWEKLSKEAKKAGYSKSRYLNTLIDKVVPKPMVSKDVSKLILEIRAVGNNINQMAKLSHIRGSADYENFKSDLESLRDVLKRIEDTLYGKEKL